MSSQASCCAPILPSAQLFLPPASGRYQRRGPRECSAPSSPLTCAGLPQPQACPAAGRRLRDPRPAPSLPPPGAAAPNPAVRRPPPRGARSPDVGRGGAISLSLLLAKDPSADGGSGSRGRSQPGAPGLCRLTLTALLRGRPELGCRCGPARPAETPERFGEGFLEAADFARLRGFCRALRCPGSSEPRTASRSRRQRPLEPQRPTRRAGPWHERASARQRGKRRLTARPAPTPAPQHRPPGQADTGGHTSRGPTVPISRPSPAARPRAG